MKTILEQIKRQFDMPEFQVDKKFEITIHKDRVEADIPASTSSKMEIGKCYQITVKQYMTKPATATFDFQDKWNKGVPMPFVTMAGTVVKETRGMLYMELHRKAQHTDRCICCGKLLSNPISKLYGLGPECGQHAYINPFDTEEELKEHLQEVQEKISMVRWQGWVIKSAIKEWKEVGIIGD
jgi:hypothetical protein